MKNTGSGTGVCAGIGCTTKDTWLGTARLRVGYAWDRWLPYLTGGAAFGNIKMTPNTGLENPRPKSVGPPAAASNGPSPDHGRRNSNISMSISASATCGAACVVSTDVSFKASVVRLGVNYRFF